ncbi:unnamed protein product [Amoebophrya sp. A120]|nr:unnamed protein product [Amoebophrya sp. A120]|eukprot:GSA120T00015054001.1
MDVVARLSTSRSRSRSPTFPSTNGDMIFNPSPCSVVASVSSQAQGRVDAKNYNQSTATTFRANTNETTSSKKTRRNKLLPFTDYKPSVEDYERLTIFSIQQQEEREDLHNQREVLQTALIPYTEDLIPCYHQWMTDPYLQQMTCSEPLSQQEEREAWRGWVTDPCKLTFLIAVPDSGREYDCHDSSGALPEDTVNGGVLKEHIAPSEPEDKDAHDSEDAHGHATTSKLSRRPGCAHVSRKKSPVHKGGDQSDDLAVQLDESLQLPKIALPALPGEQPVKMSASSKETGAEAASFLANKAIAGRFPFPCLSRHEQIEKLNERFKSNRLASSSDQVSATVVSCATASSASSSSSSSSCYLLDHCASLLPSCPQLLPFLNIQGVVPAGAAVIEQRSPAITPGDYPRKGYNAPEVDEQIGKILQRLNFQPQGQDTEPQTEAPPRTVAPFYLLDGTSNYMRHDELEIGAARRPLTASTAAPRLALCTKNLVPCGDVNLFWDAEEQIAELNVMIAHEKFRKKGVARQAVRLLMSYAHHALHVNHFRAKILEDNAASIRFFEDKLGFVLHSRKPVFNEVWYDLRIK